MKTAGQARELREQIRTRAMELGFDDCRFASASAPATGPALQRWLADGCHGGMEWMARNADKRLDPQRVLRGVRSVVSLATSYHRDVPGTAPMAGAVARYARAADYHDILREPLRRLAALVESLDPGAGRALWYVDTGPVLERDLASRAGLGFVGKHTNLVSRRLGNWFLISEILTGLELEPDRPEQNRCGSCVRCLEACPTQAITAPFRLDARRCISYLTIEHKGSIPVEFRRALGNRVFGCDDCLTVCPWNRFAKEGRQMRDAVRLDLDRPDLLELLALDEQGFRERFRGTPLERVKRRGLLRNVCVALGNVGDQQALPALRRVAMDPEPVVTEHARWAMGEIGGAERAEGTGGDLTQRRGDAARER